jgi:hypothetical protein
VEGQAVERLEGEPVGVTGDDAVVAHQAPRVGDHAAPRAVRPAVKWRHASNRLPLDEVCSTSLFEVMPPTKTQLAPILPRKSTSPRGRRQLDALV